LIIPRSSFDVDFTSGSSSTDYGYKFTVFPTLGSGECESWATGTGETWNDTLSHVIECPHNYCNDLQIHHHFGYTQPIDEMTIEFDPHSDIHGDGDVMVISWPDQNGQTVSHNFTGTNFSSLTIPGSSFDVDFTSGSTSTDYGYKFTVSPIAKNSECDSWAESTGETWNDTLSHVVECPHNYCNGLQIHHHFGYTQPIEEMIIEFDSDSDIPDDGDVMVITWPDKNGQTISRNFTGTNYSSLNIPGSSFDVDFTSGSTSNDYGYKFTVTPVLNSSHCNDWKNDAGETWDDTAPHIIESPHNYCDEVHILQSFAFTHPEVNSLEIEFDGQCDIQTGQDELVISYVDQDGLSMNKQYSGSIFLGLHIPVTSFHLLFDADQSMSRYGYRFTVTPNFTCSNWANNSGETWNDTEIHAVESYHHYCKDLNLTQQFSYSDGRVKSLRLEFDPLSELQDGLDVLTINYLDELNQSVTLTFTGTQFSSLELPGKSFSITFQSDSSITFYGYRFEVIPEVEII